MKTREMLKVIPLITLALLMSCSGEKKDAATDTHDEKVKVKIEQVSSQDVDPVSYTHLDVYKRQSLPYPSPIGPNW